MSSLIGLDDVGLAIPRPGWPGRRRTMARVALQVVGLTIFAALLVAGCSAAIVLAWAARP